MLKLLLFISPLLLFGPPTSAPTSIAVTLSTTAKQKGCIRIAVFASVDAYASEESVHSTVTPLSKEQATPLTIELPVLPMGEYAIAAFHDVNDNGKLDRNIFGVPSEPYGFVRDPTSKWRAPKWEEIAFQLDEVGAPLTINLRKWKEY